MSDVDAVGAGEPEAHLLPIEVRRGEPTAEELAAVLAVVTETYEREAATTIVEEDEVAASAWSISARALREPLRRDVGWGRFRG